MGAVFAVRERAGDVLGFHRCGTDLPPREGPERCARGFTEGGLPEGDARQTPEGDAWHEGCSPQWVLERTEMMVEAGFTHGSHSACVFYQKEKDTRAVERGDDFTVKSWIGLVLPS